MRDFGAQDGQALLPIRSATPVGVQGEGLWPSPSLMNRAVLAWGVLACPQPAGGLGGIHHGRRKLAERRRDMRRLLLLLALAMTLVGVTRAAAATSGSDSSGTHSYTSRCEAGLPHFTNTSDPASTGMA